MKDFTHGRRGLIALAACLVPALLAVLLTASCHARRGTGAVPLQPFDVESARQLVRVFDAYDYSWPPQDKVPALALQHFPQGLARMQPDVRKRTFLRAVLPMVVAVNARIRRERQEILGLLGKTANGTWPQRLQTIAAIYEVTDISNLDTARKLLLRRCNTVPPGLVLAQAAKESGWGTSRFALQANNLFGVHTWITNAGLPATGAAPSRTARVRIYRNLMHSVEDYVSNLNIGHAYVAFRKLRQREQGKGPMSSIALARTLDSYSELGERYTHRLQELILQNRLEHLSGLKLVPPVRKSAD